MKYNINIPQPCHEDWSKMLPEQQGRHCEACKTLVTDFTIMTDAEIINHLKATANKTCGRFLETQLNRELIEPTKTYNWFSIPKLSAAASILFSLLQLPVFAQNKNEIKTEQTQIQKSDSTKQKLSGDIIIKGTVLRADNNMPMDYIAVKLVNSNAENIIVFTNEDGSFTFKLSAEKYYNSIFTLRINTTRYYPLKIENYLVNSQIIDFGKLLLEKDTTIKAVKVRDVKMGLIDRDFETDSILIKRKRATRIFIDGIETKPPSDSLYQSDALQIKTDSSYNKNKIIVGGAIGTRSYVTIRQLTPWQRFKRKIRRIFF